MKIDASLGSDLAAVPAEAAARETESYDGVISFEAAHDPFLPLLLAAEHTAQIELVTSIAVAFARSPMTVAGTAHDLNAFSGGRFSLGLGSQIKPHITKRFSMPWSNPAARMKEFIQALHAIWDCWYDGKRLDFQGDYYSHTLMTPMFSPGDTGHGRPKVLLAAVGPKMTETAAAVADGLLVHPFTTERYLREVTLPTIEANLAAHGRRRDDFQMIYPIMVATGDRAEDVTAMQSEYRNRIGFYGSTPAYRPVLDLHGWGDLQPELNLLSKAGRWDDMGAAISDEILDHFVVSGEPQAVAGAVGARFGGLIDRAALDFPRLDRARVPAILAELRAG